MSGAILIPTQFVHAKTLILHVRAYTCFSLHKNFSVTYYLFFLGECISIHTVMPSSIAIYFFIFPSPRDCELLRGEMESHFLLPMMLCTGPQNGFIPSSHPLPDHMPFQLAVLWKRPCYIMAWPFIPFLSYA